MAGGPGSVPALDRAVRDFQQRNGLLVDGEVGSETFGAIHGARTRRLHRLPGLGRTSPT